MVKEQRLWMCQSRAKRRAICDRFKNTGSFATTNNNFRSILGWHVVIELCNPFYMNRLLFGEVKFPLHLFQFFMKSELFVKLLGKPSISFLMSNLQWPFTVKLSGWEELIMLLGITIQRMLFSRNKVALSCVICPLKTSNTKMQLDYYCPIFLFVC